MRLKKWLQGYEIDPKLMQQIFGLKMMKHTYLICGVNAHIFLAWQNLPIYCP